MKRQRARDRHGREWQLCVVPRAEAEAEDFRFWFEELTPAQRVDLVDECLVSCLKTRGLEGNGWERCAVDVIAFLAK